MIVLVYVLAANFCFMLGGRVYKDKCENQSTGTQIIIRNSGVMTTQEKSDPAITFQERP